MAQLGGCSKSRRIIYKELGGLFRYLSDHS